MERKFGQNETGRAHMAIDFLNRAHQSNDISRLEAQRGEISSISDVSSVFVYEIPLPNRFFRRFTSGPNEVEPVIAKTYKSGDITIVASKRAMKHIIHHADHP